MDYENQSDRVADRPTQEHRQWVLQDFIANELECDLKELAADVTNTDFAHQAASSITEAFCNLRSFVSLVQSNYPAEHLDDVMNALSKLRRETTEAIMRYEHELEQQEFADNPDAKAEWNNRWNDYA